MDKKNREREMRIQEAGEASHNPAMDEHIADALFHRATDLAYRRFGEATTDDHIEAAYERVVYNWQRGLGDAGVVTLH